MLCGAEYDEIAVARGKTTSIQADALLNKSLLLSYKYALFSRCIIAGLSVFATALHRALRRGKRTAAPSQCITRFRVDGEAANISRAINQTASRHAFCGVRELAMT